MAKKGRKPKPQTEGEANESKTDKFKRLANARVNVALKRIKLIGNLAGPGYEYTPEQVKAIEDALADAVESTMAKFDKTKGKGDAPAFQV